MRKNTLAIAIAAALAAPMAVQADTTLYGQGHASLDYLQADQSAADALATPNSEDSGFAVSNNSSRIGIKGSHKLSEGLAAVYQMEWGVALDGEGGSMSKRNRLVGLKGGFGTFVLARHDTPLKVIGRKADLFWSTQLGQNRSFTNKDEAGGALDAGWDLRSNNVIGYISPNFGPAHIFAAYVTDHDLGSVTPSTVSENNNNDAFSVALILGGGKAPYFVGIGYEQHNVDGLAAVAGLGSDDESAFRVTGTYKIGPVKLAGFYQSASDNGFIAGNDRDIYGVGAAFTAGANTFKGQVYMADERDSATGTVANTDALLYAIGWDHKLSKSTSVYAQYAALNNESAANWTLGGSGHGETANPSTGEDAAGFSAGMRIKF